MRRRHGGQWREASLRFGRTEWLDFSASLNPWGPPAPVFRAVREALETVGRYPDLEAREATAAVAAYLGVPEEALLLTHGGSEALHLAALWARRRGLVRALVAEPGFGGYAEALEAAGLPWRGLPEERVEEATGEEVARGGEATLLVLGQPNNPTGRLFARDRLLALAEALFATGGLLLADEAFVDFLPRPEEASLRQAAAGAPSGVVVAGSLTKFFTLPGLRLGYLVAPPAWREELAELQPSWSVDALAQAAAVAAVGDREFIRRSRAWLPEARAQLRRGLEALGAFRVREGAANFLLLDAEPSGLPAATWAERAAARGILLRDASDFPRLGRYHLRLAVRREEENRRLVEALGAIAREPREKGGRSPA
ncbi:MAG: aminotransferase class I/II-fold pyridoxal phosphate-dependent enzyme [Firmicutes bacterium]|nr:aminotransferase class I/II-fold pyridoxal phosphate-dependent enzyme [Bacillota bacterium]